MTPNEASAPLSYPFGDTLPEPGTAFEVATHANGGSVRWIRMPLPYALNHINLWLINEAEQGWCAVDTGMAMGDVQTHWQNILFDYPLSRQIVTHYHPDHLGLAHWLQTQTGAALWMTQGEYLTAQAFANQIAHYSVASTIALFRRHGLSDERIAAQEMRGNAYKRVVPQIPATYRKLVDNEIIEIGGHAWLVIIGTGHAPEHAALYCADLGVLIAGDMLLPSISTNIAVWAPNPDEDSLSKFLDSIDRFLELPDDTLVLPSHGRPFRGIHSRVAALHAHHADRCEALINACRGMPQTAAMLLPVLFNRDITDAHQTLFAMSEAIAHLNYLEQRGQLLRLEINNVLHYRAA